MNAATLFAVLEDVFNVYQQAKADGALANIQSVLAALEAEAGKPQVKTVVEDIVGKLKTLKL